jgi:quercetin dioxygenase-like cupin family protein
MFTKKTEGLFAKGAMRARPWRMVLAGAIVACAFGGIALRLAWATPGSGATTTTLSGPVAFDDIHVESQTPEHTVAINTRGISDVFVSHIKIVPGGHSGWHSHPGPSLISVKSGTLTLYDDCDDFQTGHVYVAGTGLVEDAGCVHRVMNEGNTDLEIVVVQIVPLGATRRIDEPAPLP